MIQEIIGNRLVAVIDILGFSKLTMNRPMQELASLVLDLFEFSNRISSGISFIPGKKSKEKAFSKSFKPCVCQFSDTIFFWSNFVDDNTDKLTLRQAAQAANLFFSLVSNFISQSLINSIPLRAGISFGETYIDSSKSIYIGEAIIRAHQLEMNQEWIGASVDTKVLQNFHSYGYLTDYNIPLKNNNIDGHALRWTSSLDNPKNILKAFKVINDGLNNNCESNIVKKYENTKKFMIEMLKNTTTSDGKCILEQIQ